MIKAKIAAVALSAVLAAGTLIELAPDGRGQQYRQPSRPSDPSLYIGRQLTSPSALLGCPSQSAFSTWLQEMRESNDGEGTIIRAISRHHCRVFKFGTTFVVDDYEGVVLVRVHAVGDRDSFWTSRLFFFGASGAPLPRTSRVEPHRRSLKLSTSAVWIWAGQLADLMLALLPLVLGRQSRAARR
jgi:hypothetical protein